MASGACLYEFARLAKGASPDVITMENVPTVAKHEVFHDFVDTLKRLGYNVWFDVVDSSRMACRRCGGGWCCWHPNMATSR
jgi:site-specific DNA-cytosine methylase